MTKQPDLEEKFRCPPELEATAQPMKSCDSWSARATTKHRFSNCASNSKYVRYYILRLYPPGQEVKLRPRFTAKSRFSLSVAVGARTHRPSLLQGEVPRMVREEEARNVEMQEDKNMTRGRRARTASRWLSSWLRGKEGRVWNRRAVVSLLYPQGTVLALHDAASARRLETPGRPGGAT